MTYTYRITNPRSLAVSNVIFTDFMTSSRTFAAPLVNPLGGTANSFAGTSSLAITGANVPANSIREITVDVDTSPLIEGVILLNQARLSGQSGSASSSTLSDYPATPIKNDPTPLIIWIGPKCGTVFVGGTTLNHALSINVPSFVIAGTFSVNPASVVAITPSGTQGSSSAPNSLGVITFTPTTGYSGEFLFRYQISDLASPPFVLQCNLRIIVAPGPTAVADSATTSQGSPVFIPLLLNDIVGDARSAPSALNPASVRVTSGSSIFIFRIL